MNYTALLVNQVAEPQESGLATPFISILVPVRNEGDAIGATLQQLLDQDYPHDLYEILVADGRSTDATREIVADFQAIHPQVKLLDNPQRWSSAGRNVALRAAKGEIVVLIDGHCEIDRRDYLTEIVSAFARSGADSLGRPQPLDISQATAVQRAIAAARASRLGHHPDSHIYSGREGFVRPDSVAVAYRREVFEKVGLFDESFDACEDVELNYRLSRAGMTCFFTPRIAIRYQPRGTLSGLLKQMARYGRGRVRMMRKHSETASLKSLLPGAFLTGLVVGPLFAWIWPMLWFVYGGVVGVYVVTVFLFSAVLAARQRRLDLLPLFALVFLSIHIGAGWGILRELCGGRSRPPA